MIKLKEYIVQAENISLKYKYIKSMSFRNFIFSFLKKENYEKRTKIVHALKGISFKIEKGKTIGIVGANGAGKSTLLRVIGGIYKPDCGIIKVNTNSVSLLSLGAGFQNDLTGLENIYINGLLLGLDKNKIDDKLNKIIEFSELGDFINAPLRTYSSGMRSKLAFSIASHIEPELLLIDEVFSVGDEKFKRKSLNKIKQLISEERTVVIVSHSLGFIKQMCDEVIWLDNGQIKKIGATEEILSEYKALMNI